jgi:hypothetical protein
MIKLTDILLTEADVFGPAPTFGGSDNAAETAIEDALDDIGAEFKAIDLEPKNVKEALGLTLAGVALSMPEIIKLIGKFVNLLSKIPGLKSLSGEQLIAIGDKMHHKLLAGIEYALKKAGVQDTVKAKKFAGILLHVVIAMLLVAGGISLSELISKGSIKGATLKTALNAIKAKELRSFILTAAGKIV